MSNEKTLYARLGRYDAIAAVVDNLLPRLISDQRLGRFWAHRGEDGLRREKQLLIDFLCQSAGGPLLECAPRAGERPSQIEYRPISGFHDLNSGFKLVRRNIADGRMKALPVIDFLEKKRKPFDHILVRFVIPEMHLLVLQSFVERFHEGVVVRITLCRHADLEAVLAEHSHIGRRGVLNAAIGVMDAAASFAGFQSHS